MADARFLLKPDHPDYGPVCPECASPKCPQSKRCAACYHDAQRRGEYPNTLPRLSGPAHPLWKPGGPHKGKKGYKRGGERYGPQSADHPWRKAEKLRLERKQGA